VTIKEKLEETRLLTAIFYSAFLAGSFIFFQKFNLELHEFAGVIFLLGLGMTFMYFWQYPKVVEQLKNLKEKLSK
jgi:hypothetical protein